MNTEFYVKPNSLPFLVLDYRGASLIILYLVVLGILVPNKMNRIILSYKNCCQKVKNQRDFN